MAVLYIRNFPADLHKQLLRYKVEDETTLSDLVVQAMTDYVQRREARERKAK